MTPFMKKNEMNASPGECNVRRRKAAVFAPSSATGLEVLSIDVKPEMADEFQESQPAESRPPAGVSRILCYKTAKDASKTKHLPRGRAIIEHIPEEGLRICHTP